MNYEGVTDFLEGIQYNTYLQALSMEKNSFYLPFPAKIKPCQKIKTVNGQQFLDPKVNPAVSRLLNVFQAFLQGTSNLKSLNMSNCEVNEDLSSEILSHFHLPRQLTRIKFSDNQIKVEGAQALGRALKRNMRLAKTLRVIDLSSCGIKDAEAEEFLANI